MDSRAALEALDQKAGRVHTLDDAQRVYEKSRRDPAAILEDDLTIVRYFYGDKRADEYAALRAKAIAGPPPPTPVTNAAAPAAERLQKWFDVYTEKCLTPVLKKALGQQRDRIAALEQRLAAVEEKPYVKFCGTYEHGKAYTPGDAALHHSALWICKVATTGEPSKDFVGWQLALKSRSVQP